MKLTSVTANRHIWNGQENGKPLRLLVKFDGDVTLRLQVAGDGQRMVVDDGSLDAPFDISECGRIDVVDVTATLFPTLRDLVVTDVEALARHGNRAGVKLNVTGGEPFYLWIDDDELHWGDAAPFIVHDWQDGLFPSTSGRIEV